jgi:hypothetical protein
MPLRSMGMLLVFIADASHAMPPRSGFSDKAELYETTRSNAIIESGCRRQILTGTLSARSTLTNEHYF